MRILIYGINYAPELTGIGKYSGEMGAWLAKQGHDVEVVTAFPYYPEWQIHDRYKGKKRFNEIMEGVKVHRHPLYVPGKVTSAKRIVHEFSFLLSTFPTFFGFLFKPAFDVVICISPPFHLGLYPLLYAKLRGAKLVSHIQDLQVDAARDLQMIRNKTALNIMFSLEKFILKSSSAVSTISKGMMKKILAKGLSPSKMILFPNWVDETAITPLTREQSLRKEFGIDLDKQVVLYSGNLGEKQGLEIILDVAKEMEREKDVLFVIVGSGGGKEKLVQSVKDANLTNIVFFPLQPYEKLSALLAIADLHLVLQKKSASDLVLPSKLTAILASGGCALVTASPGTSLFDIVSEHSLGIIVEPESVDSLLAGVRTALNSDLTVFQTNARKYSERFLSKESVLRQWENDLHTLSAKNENTKAELTSIS